MCPPATVAKSFAAWAIFRRTHLQFDKRDDAQIAAYQFQI
jgi:hypothetical protein